jgi:phosphoribosylformylglycinamidine cyclo-ligase
VKIAAGLGRYDTIGHDIVNHCVNDIGVHGARPLFFLDYLALHRTEPELVATVVGGVASACRAVACALLGGETAEMPDLYGPGELDLAGFIVGVVEREQAVLGEAVAVGDRLLGLPSSGLHTNGYSLARRVLPRDSWGDYEPSLGRTIGEALLEPHRSYLEPIQKLLELGARAFAHITGGGFAGNVGRVLPNGLAGEIDLDAWKPPALFRLIADRGAVARDELYRVFNMGIGLVAILPSERVVAAHQAVPECVEIGRVVARAEGAPVRLIGRGYGTSSGSQSLGNSEP